MEMPNVNAVAVGKAGAVEDLPIPEWARASFAPGPVPVLFPAAQYAAARMVAFGGKRARQEVIWPFFRRRMREGSLEEARGRQMLSNPAGVGVRYG